MNNKEGEEISDKEENLDSKRKIKSGTKSESFEDNDIRKGSKLTRGKSEGDKVEIVADELINKWVDTSDILNKSIRNIEDFEKNPSPISGRPGTRSQTGIQHVQLPIIKNTRKIIENKMATGKLEVTLNLTEALHLIPKYSGETDIHPFLSTCDTVIGMVAEAHVPLLIKMITTTKLTGRAFNVTRYREAGNWEVIKQELLNSFEPPYASANLQIELNLIKMGQNETISEYTNRVEGIFQKLCNANSLNKTESDARAIRENIKEQALVSYINGLTDQLKFEVKTKNPDTLEKAMIVAALAEKDIKTYNEAQEFYNRTRNSNNNNRNNNKNNNINNNNEWNRPESGNNNYRDQNYQSFNNNNGNRGQFRRNNNNNNNNRDNYPRNNYNNSNSNNNNNNSGRFCNICSRDGHYASQCKLRQVRQNGNNFNNNFSGQNYNRGNNFTRPPTNYNNNNNNNNQMLSCTYCNRLGHEITTCYIKQNNERRNNGYNNNNNTGNNTNNEVNNQNSENFNRPATGARDVRLIEAIPEMIGHASTSYHQ
jgi:hypothetical protein